MSVSEFRVAMARCHRAQDLFALFQTAWPEVSATYGELVQLRNEFVDRHLVLTTAGVAEGCNQPVRAADLRAAQT